MLTFGVEIECVATLGLQELQSDRIALEFIASSIRDLGFQADVFLPRSTRDQPNYTVWNVCLDVTILEETSSTGSPEEDDEDLQLYGVEIVSPVFEAKDNWRSTIENFFWLVRLGSTDSPYDEQINRFSRARRYTRWARPGLLSRAGQIGCCCRDVL